MPSVTLTKCQGTGNDFVLLDNRDGIRFQYAALARAACDRRFGVGADGLLVLLRAAANSGADVAMRIFNADGSEAEMCGNGIRCIARYLVRDEQQPRRLAVQTPAGIVRTELTGVPGMVRVDMGVPMLARPLEGSFEFDGRTFTYARISMGNPHAVIFVDDALDAYQLEALAAAASRACSDAAGINVELARVTDGRIEMRIHERGVGETWACGTGACAAAAAAIATGRLTSPVEVVTRGGSVDVIWKGADDTALLTGPAEIVFETTLQLAGDVLASA
jgi:diaminopimelate epimerase